MFIPDPNKPPEKPSKTKRHRKTDSPENTNAPNAESARLFEPDRYRF